MTSIVLSGWACRTARYFPDGRRQILNVILPGEIFHAGDQQVPLSTTVVTAITPLRFCGPAAALGSALSNAYTLSDVLDNFYSLRQIVRSAE